jgi:type II secretory pathway pseudopilin PulG
MKCKPLHAGSGACRGFSLIEALIGLMMLLVVVLMLIGAIPTAYAFTARDSVRVQAVAAGQDYLDIIRQYVESSGVVTNLPAAPVIAIDSGYGFVSDATAPSPSNFSMTPRCTARSLFSYDCVVTVNWSQNGANAQSATVESYIASQAGF